METKVVLKYSHLFLQILKIPQLLSKFITFKIMRHATT